MGTVEYQMIGKCVDYSSYVLYTCVERWESKDQRDASLYNLVQCCRKGVCVVEYLSIELGKGQEI